eukprot:comp12343_c0_seq1/m.7201 comp12343_c0_seq1/g.7201  ORF comp12343_c0_seq1/g.7201 comp12343_c0_seq1/m.7201 type:complete len:309 (-) comp12343_c0_seq1:284-1210(-)
MVVHVHCEAHIALTPADYWVIRNTPEFFALECKYLKNASKTMISEVKDKHGEVISQELATKPDTSGVPQWILSMGPAEGIVFTDHLEFVRNNPETPYYIKIRTVPSIFPERCNIQGFMKIIPSEDGKSCTQVIDMNVEINVFAAGIIIEQVVSSGLHNAYNLLPQIVEDWKKEAQSADRWNIPELAAEDNSPAEWDEDSGISAELEDEFYDAPDVSFSSAVTRAPETNLSRCSSATMSLSHTSEEGGLESGHSPDRLSPEPGMIISAQPSFEADDRLAPVPIGHRTLPPASNVEGGLLCGLGGFRLFG